MTPIVFLDTETTGLHADRRAWDIAMIRRDADGHQRELQMFVDVDLSSANLRSLHIGRFYDRHPLYNRADGQFYTESAAAYSVEEWTRGAHIVGAVPNFDTECLAAMLRRHRLCPAWHFHLIDVEALMVGYLHGQATVAERAPAVFGADPTAQLLRDHATVPWKSDDLSRAIGVEPPVEGERHTAMGDARWCMRIWDKITAGGAQ
ncbi:3'-5' exonuclease family protein [Nocardia puris]|uniref:Uncharacterized protein DUF5051 n=1 Tax=Nocardia puris TaxID=208602 RepID=A0A366DBX8_9NOCA|nr:3'-5' exoribonuclease [Nocardia puris]RBO87557.1 uncharacterized protein DUF5051 [Nocardia puris]